MYVCRVADNAVKWSLPPEKGPFRRVRFSEDGKSLIALTGEGTRATFNTIDGKETERLDLRDGLAIDGEPFTLSDDDSTIAVLYEDGPLRVYDRKTKKVKFEEPHQEPVMFLREQEGTIFLNRSRSLYAWDWKTGKSKRTILPSNNTAQDNAFQAPSPIKIDWMDKKWIIRDVEKQHKLLIPG